MIGVAQYNDFINSPAVTKGWVVLRDLCNMFFIIVLLVIAFATVLGSEKYSIKKYLIPLLLMAVLINFSKMIAGLFIDISQVAMLQFVNGFKYAAAGNLTTAFGLNELLAIREVASNDPNLVGSMSSEVLISLMLAVSMLVVAVVVTGVILVVFLLRIVALWILVMLSPVAYLAQATPGAEKYASMWWENFSKYVIAGPVLAFFLWISLSIMAINPSNVDDATNIHIHTENLEQTGLAIGTAEAVSVGISRVGQSDQILSFAISIAILVASLAATQKLGVAGASLAMAAKGKLEAAGKKFAKVGLGIGAVAGTPWGLAAAGAKLAQKTPWLAKKGVGFGLRELAATTGIELRPSKIKESIKTAFAKRVAFRELEAMSKKGDLFGHGGLRSKFAIGAPMWVDKYLSGFLGLKGLIGKKGSGAFFRRTPTAERADKEEDKLNEKIKQKEAIDERLAKGAVADGYMEELKARVNEKTGWIKSLDAQIREINGDNLTRQAKTLRDKANEAKNKGNEVIAQNLNDQAKALEKRAQEKETRANTQGTDEYQKIQELKLERPKHLQEAKNLGKKLQEMKDPNKTFDEKEKSARASLNLEAQKLEVDIAKLRKVQPGDSSTFTTEQREAFSKLTDEIKELTVEIDKWGGRKEAPKEIVDRIKKREKQLGEIGSSEDNKIRIAALEAKRAELIGRISGKALEESKKDELKATKKAMEEQIKEDEKKLKKMRGAIPRDYYARQARRQAWAQERSKIDTKEEDELIDLFESALARKEKTLAAALLTQIAASNGLNTLINNHGYDSGPQGFNSFTEDVLRKQLGMSEQEALGLQNDACEIAANQSNHLTFAKGVGIKNGRYVQVGGTMENPDPESLINQQYYAYVEMSKLDKETVARRMNRLGYGKEDKYGNFTFNEAGLWWMRDNWGTINNEIGRGRFNINAAQKFLDPGAIAQLRGLVNDIPPEKIADYMDFLDILNSYGKRTAPSMAADKQVFARKFGVTL